MRRSWSSTTWKSSANSPKGCSGTTSQQKAIIASGFSETERVRETQRRGAGGYIRKPYLMEGIGLAVRNELDRAPAA